MSQDLDLQRSQAVGHEVRDASPRPVLLAGAGLAILVVLVVAGLWGLFNVLAARQAEMSPAANPLTAESAREQPPHPRLQAAPIDDLRRLREAEEKILTTYGWSDLEEGTVRIPIERAMDLLAARGIRPREEGP